MRRAPAPRRRPPRLHAPVAAAVIVVLITPPASGSEVAFADGFESGDLLAWTSSSNTTVQGTHVFAGQWAGRLTASRTKAHLTRHLDATHTDLTLDARLKLLSRSGSMKLYCFRTSTGEALLSLRLDGTGKLNTRNHVTGTTTKSSTTVGTGEWRRLELRALIQGSSSRIEVWLDGDPVSPLTKDTSLGTAPVGRIQVGNTRKEVFDLAVDDVATVVPTVQPDETPPTQPAGLSAQATSSSRVDLSWTASTDDVGVTGYTAYRDGAQLATVPGTSTTYADTSVQPFTTYEYRVDAFDAAGNHSPLSDPASATTPAPPEPSDVISSDSFDRPDSGQLGAADTGEPWAHDSASTWGIEGGRARKTSGPSDGRAEAWIDAGVSDGVVVEADIALSPTFRRANVGLVFRLADSNNHLWSKIEVTPGNPDGLMTIGKTSGGSVTSRLAGKDHIGITNGTTYRVAVSLDESLITMSVSGGNLPAPETITYTLTAGEATKFNANTGYGLRSRPAPDEDDGLSTWDNFSVRVF